MTAEATAMDGPEVRRALIAECGARTRSMVREALDYLGVGEVLTCESAAELFKLLRAGRENSAAAGIDLLVCGRLREHAFETSKLLERIRIGRFISAGASLVAITTERTAQAVIGLAVHGADACVLKPFTSTGLAQRLSQIVSRKRPLDPLFAALEAGDHASALAVARALPEAPRELRLCAFRAVCERLLDARDATRAEAVIEEADAKGSVPWARLATARIRALQGDLDTARALLERLKYDCPEFVAPYDALAVLEKDRGEYRSALRHLDDATQLAGISVERMRRTGETAALAGELELAGQAFGRMLDRAGDGELIECSDYAEFIDVLLRAGRHERAALLARDLRLARPESIEAHVVNLAVTCSRASAEGTTVAANSALAAMLRTHDRGGLELSIPTRMLVLEACVEQGASRDARTVAQGIALAENVNDVTLRRVAELLSG